MSKTTTGDTTDNTDNGISKVGSIVTSILVGMVVCIFLGTAYLWVNNRTTETTNGTNTSESQGKDPIVVKSYLEVGQ